MSRHPLAGRFERFSEICFERNAPLYARLARYVAGDSVSLHVAAHAVREPTPNVFFGAVHYLMLKGARHALREFYPSLADEPRQDDKLFGVFSDFCEQFREELVELVATRLVQTNEVNRCAVLAPAFSLVYDAGRRAPMSLVEIGSSAGLNLLWDQYRMVYSDGTLLGAAASPVELSCENRGAPLARPDAAPMIADRVGIDFHPIDLADPDERLWLRALVWPDHPRRAARLEAAIKLAAGRSPTVIQGDALEDLPAILAKVPPHLTLCVFQSSVLYQFTPVERQRFEQLLAEASRTRPLWHVSAESEEGLFLRAYRKGVGEPSRFLGAFESHGRWLSWRDGGPEGLRPGNESR